MMNNHQLNLLKVNKIKYKFELKRFDYSLPIFGVDLEFLSLRRNEVLDCMDELKLKVSTIDFVNLSGADEFHIADSIVKWYQLALREINTKEYMLGMVGDYNPQNCSAAHAEYMYKATRERTK